MNNTEHRLAEHSYPLPAVFPRMGTYEPFVITGNLLSTSGAAPQASDGTWMIGKVGTDFSAEQAYQHAHLVGLQLLAVMKETLGDLNRVKRVVKVLGMVNAAPEFTQFTQVINGCSEKPGNMPTLQLVWLDYLAMFRSKSRLL